MADRTPQPLRSAREAAALGPHIRDPDPHPQYMRREDVDEAVADAGASLAAHVAAADPHPQYATKTELDDHAERTDNPHATTAPQAGALWAPGQGPGGGAVYDARDGGLIMDVTKTPPEQVMAA